MRGQGSLFRRVTLVAGLAFASNGLTLGVLSYALLGLRNAWNLTPGQASAITMAAGAGQLVGGVVMGHTADVIGRRLGYGFTIALTALATGIAALAPSLAWLILLMFLSGVGFGGVAPVATSLVGEFAPRQHRGQMMGWTQAIWILGWIAAAAGGVFLVHGLGWRGVFAIGILPIVLAVLGPRLVPESPRFLLSHGRRREAEALVTLLRERYGSILELPAQEQAHPASIAAQLREFWSPRFRRSTVLVWTVWFVMIGAYNGPVLWLPAMMSAGGFAHAAEAAFVVGLASLPLTVTSTLLLDRVGRKPVIIAALSLGAVGALGVAVARTEPVFVLAGIGLSGGTLAAWPVILTYAAELYPTRIRATAIGWASAAGRSAGILAPAMLGILMSSWSHGRGPAMVVFAVGLAGAALLVLFLGEETAGRSLEEIAEVGAPSVAAPPRTPGRHAGACAASIESTGSG